MKYNGSCLCEKIRFEFDDPVKFVAHCHCSICRRAHGAPVVTWVGLKAGQLKITDGVESLRTYRSSPQAERQFCSHCGTSLFFRPIGQDARWAGEVHVARAAVHDSATDGAGALAPKAHVFYSDRARWFDDASALPCYGGVSGTEKLTPGQ